MDAKDFFADALNQLQAGSWQDALDALSIAIELDANFIEAYTYRGVAYYQLGDYESAMNEGLRQVHRVVAEPCGDLLLQSHPLRAAKRA